MLLSPSPSPPSLSLSFPFSLTINEKNLKNEQTKQQLYESVMPVTHPTRGPLKSLSGCSFHGVAATAACCDVITWCVCLQVSSPSPARHGWRCEARPPLSDSQRPRQGHVPPCLQSCSENVPGPWHVGSYFVLAQRALAKLSACQQPASLTLTRLRKCLSSGSISAESFLPITRFVVPEGRCLPEIEPSVLIGPLAFASSYCMCCLKHPRRHSVPSLQIAVPPHTAP